MAIIEDRRTPEQLQTHKYLVLATDKYLSGWGLAEGGASYAAWACETKADADRVMWWVQTCRADMIRARLVYGRYRPGPRCAHLSIYVPEHESHPAFSFGRV